MNTRSITRMTKLMFLCLLILSTACSPLVVLQPVTTPLSTALPTQDLSATVVVSIQQTLQVQTPLPTITATLTQAATTETIVPATNTPLPTITPLPSATPTNLPVATSIPNVTGCQDAAQYITDDGLDGTIYAPNTAFTKTWTLKNTGSCTWTDHYLVAYLSGATLTQQPGYFLVPQGQTVVPGQAVNIAVGMTSPPEEGTYRSNWGLENGEGQLLPVQGGVNGESFYAQIKVSQSSTETGKVTDASIDIQLEQGSGTACTSNSTYFVQASITTDGPARPAYEISSTAGQISAGYFEDLETHSLSPVVSGRLAFDRADTKTIHLRFVGPYPYPDDISVVLRVNGGEFYTAKLSCR